MRSEFFRLDMPLHETLTFHKWEFPSEKAGPLVTVLAGIHGDDLNGPYIAWRLTEHFRSKGGPAAGTIRIIPAANPIGLNLSSHFWPFDQMDINTLFPGYAGGETAQRVAAGLFREIEGSDWCLNLCASTEMVEEIPQVRLYDAAHAYAGESASFGLPLVWKRHASHPRVRIAFPSRMAECGVKTLALHLGAPRRIDQFHCESMLEGILRFLGNLGMTPAPPFPTTPSRVLEDSDVVEVLAPDAGFFLREVELGRELAAGEILGSIVDPIGGGAAKPIRSPARGLVSTIRTHPLTYEGELLARIAAAGSRAVPRDDRNVDLSRGAGERT